MTRDRSQPELCFADRGATFAVSLSSILACTLVCTGCASPGPPRPPSLNLPALVTDLGAERVGDRVLLHWTTPSSTTDDLPVKGKMSAQVCRETGARPTDPVGRIAACVAVLRLAVAPGISEVVDPLPRPLTTDPVGLITYRVQILNETGRSAGDSRVAGLAAAGTAPPPVEAFSAIAGEAGAILEWRKPQRDAKTYLVDIKKIDLSALPAQKGTGPNHAAPGQRKGQLNGRASQPPRDIHLRSADAQMSLEGMPGSELSGTVDSTAKMGNTYTYVAARVRPVTIGVHVLEIDSEPSLAVTLAMRDTFPPRIPSGLYTVPSVAGEHAYIDLSWEPNIEPDLAGYFVYRQLVMPNGERQGPLGRLTPLPISSPAYRDMAVMPRQRYIYSVTAVDASGNESAPSAEAQEVVPSPK